MSILVSQPVKQEHLAIFVRIDGSPQQSEFFMGSSETTVVVDSSEATVQLCKILLSFTDCQGNRKVILEIL